MEAGNLAEIIQAGASILGLAVIYFQIQHLIKNIQGTTQDNIYSHYNDICKMLLQQPHLRPYFYEGKALADTDPESETLRAEVDYMSEMILGVIEHAVVQECNLPPDAWKNCWKPYARERLKKGTEMRRFFQDNKQWYTRALRDAVEEFDKEDEAAAQLEASARPQSAARRANLAEFSVPESA